MPFVRAAAAEEEDEEEADASAAEAAAAVRSAAEPWRKKASGFFLLAGGHGRVEEGRRVFWKGALAPDVGHVADRTDVVGVNRITV